MTTIAPQRGSSALLDVLEHEAAALADRMHDGVLQQLVVARYAADAAVRGGDPALARDRVQEALISLRRLVWQLRPRGEEGLVAALFDLSGQLVSAGEPPLRLDLDAATAAALPPAAVATAYRLVQATGPRSVRLARTGDRAVLDVDGPLLDPRGWPARARALGGELLTTSERTGLLLPLTAPSYAPTNKDLP